MSKFSIRQPVVIRAGVALVVMGAARIAAWAGWIPEEWGNVELDRVEQLFDLVVLYFSWRSIHKVVTPVAAPRANDGKVLVPISDPLQRPRSL